MLLLEMLYMKMRDEVNNRVKNISVIEIDDMWCEMRRTVW